MRDNLHTERRCSDRISISLPVQIQYEDKKFNATVIDLSTCGSGALITEFLPVFSELILSLQLPSDEGFIPLKIPCVVVHSNHIRGKHLCGLKFIDLSASNAFEINTFFSYHSRFSA